MLNKTSTNSSETPETDTSSKLTVKCGCVQDDILKLDSIYPFKLDFNVLTMQVNYIFIKYFYKLNMYTIGKLKKKMKPIEVLRMGEPFLLLCEIKNETTYSLRFKNSSLRMVKLFFKNPNPFPKHSLFCCIIGHKNQFVRRSLFMTGDRFKRQNFFN